MKNVKLILLFWVIFTSFICFSMFKNEEGGKDLDVYEKQYDILFRRFPEENKHMLFRILHNPKNEIWLKGFWDTINQSKNYFYRGGSIEDFDTKNKKNVGEKTFELKKIRQNLLLMLIKIIEKNEDFIGKVHDKYEFLAKILVSNNKKIFSGERSDGSNVKEPIIIKNLFDLEKAYKECCKSNEDCSFEKKQLDEFKQRLAGHYKIHMMPQEKDVLKVVQMLMKSLKEDDELGALIDKFKIKADLSLQYQNDNKESPYALIVIYPAEGKDKVQKLLDKLLIFFKGIKGLDVIPRYNLKVNDLIFYAQGDADYKKPNKNGEQSAFIKYFDKNKNYALYKDDFEDQPHESYELKF